MLCRGNIILSLLIKFQRNDFIFKVALQFLIELNKNFRLKDVKGLLFMSKLMKKAYEEKY